MEDETHLDPPARQGNAPFSDMTSPQSVSSSRIAFWLGGDNGKPASLLRRESAPIGQSMIINRFAPS